MWNVWKIDYATYAEVAERGDIPPVLIATGLSLEAALKCAEAFGLGHCVKPA